MQPGVFSHRGDVKLTVMSQQENIVQSSLDTEFGDKNLFIKYKKPDICTFKKKKTTTTLTQSTSLLSL